MTILDILIIIFLFWLLSYIIFSFIKKHYKNTKILNNIEIQPLILLLKTGKFNNFILNTGKKRARAFKIIGELSIAYGIALMAYAIFFLFKNLLALLVALLAPSAVTNIAGPASPVIPLLFGITFTPPLDQLIIILLVIAVAAIFHELFHGFLASSQEMKIKSTGAGLLFLIPIAFVEIDDESIKNMPARNKLRMLGGGSFINMTQAMVFLALISTFPLAIAWGYSMDTSGVLIYSVSANSPAYSAGIMVGDAIIAMNHTPIKNYQEFVTYLEKTKPDQTLILTIERNLQQIEFTIKLGENPYYKDRGFIGVSTLDYHRPIFSFIPPILQYYIYVFLIWGFAICLSLAVFNMLPIPLFDGDKFLSELLSPIKNGTKKSLIQNSLRIFSLMLLFLNIYLSLVKFGLLT